VAGAFVGLFWGFVSGFVMGWFIAFVRNFVIAMSVHAAGKGRTGARPTSDHI
jgi:hypothetical protein